MKKLLLIGLVALLVGCSSKEEDCKEANKLYLQMSELVSGAKDIVNKANEFEEEYKVKKAEYEKYGVSTNTLEKNRLLSLEYKGKAQANIDEYTPMLAKQEEKVKECANVK